ncbi:MAG: spermidine/putrescine ABC transporter substrate-binding protein [Actinomycetales bacterium]|nr:spermidine/putrescine ABC transporter substrate-binding protein [Actinomycetales bacterium]
MNKPLPEDPMMRQLVQMARRHQMTRRAALSGAGATAAALALTACSPAGSAGTKALTPAKDVSATEKSVIWANWDLYMDEDDNGNHPTLQRFEKESGIKVEYRIEIEDNDSYNGKIKDQLKLGADIGADVACPTEWMAARWVNNGYLQKFTDANIPNKKNLQPAYLGAAFDPKREYTLPYQGILGGITYNKEAYKKLTGKDAPASLDDLFVPELKGRIGVLKEMRDTIGLILLSQGIAIADPKSLTEDAYMNAIDYLKAKVADLNVKIKGQGYAVDFENGDTVAAIAWSGDTVQMNLSAGREKYGFVIPESGATITADEFVIPMGATHKANAEALINYYYDPKNAAELAAWVNYVTPVVGAQEEAQKIDPALASNQLIFPSGEFLANTHAWRSLSASEEQRFTKAWQSVQVGA